MKLINILIVLHQTCSLLAQTSTGPIDIQSIVDTVNKLETAVSDLKSKVTSDSQMYAAEIAMLRTQVTQAEDDLRASEAEATKLRKDLQIALSELQVVKSQVSISGRTQNLTTDALKQVQDELRSLIANFTAEIPDMLSSQAAVSAISSQMNSTKQDLNNLKYDVNSQNLNSTLMWNEINSLKSNFASTGNDLMKMSGSLQALHLNEATSQQTITRLQHKQSDDEIKSAALANDIVALTSNISDLMHAYAVDSYNLAELKGHIDLLERDVAFEATISTGSRTSIIPSGAALRFNTIAYNAGHGYDPSTGVFTAPFDGTYLFWINAVYYSNNIPVDVEIRSSRSVIGVGYGDAAFGERYGTVNTNTIAHLRKGETVWFTPSDGMRLKEWFSSIGGCLLRPH